MIDILRKQMDLFIKEIEREIEQETQEIFLDKGDIVAEELGVCAEG